MKLFKKLWEMLLDSVLLFGAEVWSSCGKLAPIEKIQLRVVGYFCEWEGSTPRYPFSLS